MTWSYSRITSFEDCPYRFFLKYIKLLPSEPKFFASYGTFMHSILAKYTMGELSRSELAPYYLLHFLQEVPSKAPSSKVFSNYFSQGVDYLEGDLQLPPEIHETEARYRFMVGDRPFVGIVDLVCQNDELCIIDHKSRALKPRSRRSKPTKGDQELDRYLRQLYLYSLPVSQRYGACPKTLCFNCFRQKCFIREPFVAEQQKKAVSWALNTIEQIEQNESWNPNIEPFKCRYICDVSYACEYPKMFGGGSI